MGNRVGARTRRGTVGPMAFGTDPGDSFLVALTAERGPADRPTLITSMSRFRSLFGEATPFDDGTRYSDGWEVLRAYYSKQGRSAWVLRVVSDDADTAHVDIQDRQSTEAEDTLRVKGAGPGTWAEDYEVRIEDGTKDDTFRLVVVDATDEDDQEDVEEFDNLTMSSSSLETVNDQSDFVRLEDLESGAESDADALPATGTYDLDDTQAGADGNDLDATEVVGDTATDGTKTGLHCFREHRFGRGFIVAPGLDEGANRQEVGDELVENGEMYHRIPLTVADEGTMPADAADQRDMYDSYTVGFYYGRPERVDDHSDELKTFSPAGHIVADYLRAIERDGPGKAPAGSDFRINHVRSIESRQDGTPLVDEGTAEELMSDNINPIWDRNGTGPKVWGARAATSEDAWRFLHVAYLYNRIASEVSGALDQLVYDNASDPLFFSQLRAGVRNFMIDLHGDSAFHGEIPASGEEPDPEVHAFNVQADEGLLSAQDKEEGNVRVRIEFVPAITAESIIVDIAKRNHA